MFIVTIYWQGVKRIVQIESNWRMHDIIGLLRGQNSRIKAIGGNKIDLLIFTVVTVPGYLLIIVPWWDLYPFNKVISKYEFC